MLGQWNGISAFRMFSSHAITFHECLEWWAVKYLTGAR